MDSGTKHHEALINWFIFLREIPTGRLFWLFRVDACQTGRQTDTSTFPKPNFVYNSTEHSSVFMIFCFVLFRSSSSFNHSQGGNCHNNNGSGASVNAASSSQVNSFKYSSLTLISNKNTQFSVSSPDVTTAPVRVLLLERRLHLGHHGGVPEQVARSPPKNNRKIAQKSKLFAGKNLQRTTSTAPPAIAPPPPRLRARGAS